MRCARLINEAPHVLRDALCTVASAGVVLLRPEGLAWGSQPPQVGHACCSSVPHAALRQSGHIMSHMPGNHIESWAGLFSGSVWSGYAKC